MGVIYYIILSIIVVAFLVCIVFTVFDNTKDIPKAEKKMTTFKSRRTLYSDYLERVSENNYYSYNYYKKKDHVEILDCEDKNKSKTVEQPTITSITEISFLDNTQTIPILDV